MKIEQLDHLVLTVADVEVSAAFYAEVLGMEIISFGNQRTAMHFGSQKINLHAQDSPIIPHAAHPQPGAADLCFITSTILTEVELHLQQCGVAVIEGPVNRNGASGPIRSLYFRDPDQNLIEVANRLA